jgi:alpha 1,3-glucosidase
MIPAPIKIIEKSDDKLVFEMEDHNSERMKKRWPMYEHTDRQGEMSSIRYEVQYKPFKLTGFRNGIEMVSVNGRQMMNMEYERNYIEHYKFYNKVQVDSTYKFPFELGPTDDFTEMFDGKVEKFPMGPRAISLDFEVAYDAEFAGIPERTSTDGHINLDNTLDINFDNDTDILKDPYRLFNLDVTEYQTNNSYLGLYGSIPYLMSYSNKFEGNVGIYWINSAETWVDLYSAKYATLTIEE